MAKVVNVKIAADSRDTAKVAAAVRKMPMNRFIEKAIDVAASDSTPDIGKAEGK